VLRGLSVLHHDQRPRRLSLFAAPTAGLPSTFAGVDAWRQREASVRWCVGLITNVSCSAFRFYAAGAKARQLERFSGLVVGGCSPGQ
jgi:hypothetical protein